MNLKRILSGRAFKLFLSTCLALYLELVFIRWVSSEVRIFAFLKNVPLVMAFLGLSLGIMLEKKKISIKPVLPYMISGFSALLVLAPFLGISDTPIPAQSSDVWVWGASESVFGAITGLSAIGLIMAYAAYAAIVVLFVFLIFAVFFGIGEIIHDRLEGFQPLKAYGIDLLGSMSGVILFTAVSFLQLSPFWWLLIGFLLLFAVSPLNRPFAISSLAVLVIAALGTSAVYWSPYYRIETKHNDARSSEISAIYLNVNHAYHQHMADYSAESLQKYPESKLQATAFDYNLPYAFIKNPGNVLVVGAGAGNDVAAAVRNGATHVDAVEIDPAIIRLGREYHPEKPYASEKVNPIVDDARSFFEKNNNKYDTIIYGLLDSHTSVSAFSSVRLDNYVYTLESYRAAKKHLEENGVLSLTFAAGKPWILARQASMLKEAFGYEPLVFRRASGGDGGIFIIGRDLNRTPFEKEGIVNLQVQLPKIENLKIPSDDWPYLYLRNPSIPLLYLGTLLLVVAVFFAIVYFFIGRQIFYPIFSRRFEYWHFFFLGAAFLLIETKSINQLSLLFGSTWIVNSAVILGILTMAFLANSLVMSRIKIPFAIIAAGLFFSLALGYFVKVGIFAGEPFIVKFLLAGLFVALPLFFSGLLFSSSFKQTSEVPFAFGANLFGAFLGGLAENAAMITGTNALALVAMVFYGAALAFRPKSPNREMHVLTEGINNVKN